MLISLLPTAFAGAATATPSERPRPENFANYSLYVQALVDHQRAQENTPPTSDAQGAASSDSQFCKDDQGQDFTQGSSGERKKNSCEGKYLLTENTTPEDTERKKPKQSVEASSAYESLEEAIAKAQYSMPAETVVSSSPNEIPTGLPLAELPAQDLSQLGVDGLLGLFDNVRMHYLPDSGSTAGTISLEPDGSIRATVDKYVLSFDQLGFSMLAGFTILGDGYSIVNAATTIRGSSLDISLSSETHTSLYIVDRDGVPAGGHAEAGALSVDQLGVIIPRLNVTMQGVRTTNSDGLFQLNATSPQAIYVNLSNTHIGAADARSDGSGIGTATNFMEFGPQSILSIAPGTTVSALINKPDGTRTAFITLNGRVGDINLEDISLVDNNSGGAIRIGKLGISHIYLSNAQVFLNDRQLVVDTGHSLGNTTIAIERFSLGSDPVGSNVIGDFYATSGRLTNLRFTAEPH